MSTTVVSKIANPFASGGSMTYPSGTGIPQVSGGASWGSTLSTTGTGNVVLSDSPTLTGNVTANVNLRYGSMSSLLALPGGASEIGYASDVDSLVKFNGVGGQAEVFGKYTNGTTLNYVLTDANYTNVIDCRYVSYLNITIDPLLSATITNLNIKLPLSTSIQELKILINAGFNLNSLTVSQITITMTYQTEDIALGNNQYIATPNDPYHGYTYSNNVAGFNINGTSGNNLYPYAFLVTFIVPGTYGAGWTRLPLQGEATIVKAPTPGYIGEVVAGGNASTSLTTGTVANTGYFVLTPGTWLLYGTAYWTVSSGAIASELNASHGNTSPSTLSLDGTSNLQVNGAIGTVISGALGNITYYTDALNYATFTGVGISTGGVFTCTSNAFIVVGTRINVFGTLTGTGSITGYTSPTTYQVTAITGSIGAVTGFTLKTLYTLTALTTTAGTSTGLTFQLVTKTLYTNARATFSSGTVSVRTYNYAVRIA